MRAGRQMGRVDGGGALPLEGEGRSGYKSVVAVTYPATIATTMTTNTSAANDRFRSVPGPLCGCSRLSNMIVSCRPAWTLGSLHAGEHRSEQVETGIQVVRTLIDHYAGRAAKE